jgi:AcrR family transcriptional regulator
VSYHYGGKQGLYEAILERLGGERLESAQRILGRPPRDLADFETRMLLFAEEMLATYMAEPSVLVIFFAEWQQGFRNCNGASTTEAMLGQTNVIIKFLRAAQRKRLLRKGVDPAIVAGAFMERLTSQALYADTIESVFGTSIKSKKYLRHWTQQTVDLLLHGAVARPTEE